MKSIYKAITIATVFTIACSMMFIVLLNNRESFKASVESIHEKRKKVKLDKIKNFLKEDNIDERKYNIENYNCADFSEDLIERAEERDFTSGSISLYKDNEANHRVVLFKLENKSILVVEPQTDSILGVFESYDEILNSYNKVYRIKARWNTGKQITVGVKRKEDYEAEINFLRFYAPLVFTSTFIISKLAFFED